MPYEGWLELAGNEIVNNARVTAYTKAFGIDYGSCDPCAPYLPEALCNGTEYNTPEIDEAPWYDPARPESARFLGAFGLSVSGLTNNTVTRNPQPLLGDGSAIGRARRAHREIHWQVSLVALDEYALSYAREWLAAALQPDVCAADGCHGGEAEFMAMCPCQEDCQGETGIQERRTMVDVGVLEGPTQDDMMLLDYHGCAEPEPQPGCGQPVAATMSFTLIAGRPYLFLPPLQQLPTCTDLHLGRKIPNLDPDEILAKCPPPPVSCLADPNCVPPPLPPQPPVPRDPCYPRGKFNALQQWLSVEAECMSDWLTHVPVVEVYAGDKELRRLTVRFHLNPAGLECTQLTDPCAACVDIDLGYLPAGSTLTLDGRTERAWVDCSGGTGTVTATPVLYGAGGSAWTWPTFDCPSGLCIELLYADPVDKCAYATVMMYPRADAA